MSVHTEPHSTKDWRRDTLVATGRGTPVSINLSTQNHGSKPSGRFGLLQHLAYRMARGRGPVTRNQGFRFDMRQPPPKAWGF